MCSPWNHLRFWKANICMTLPYRGYHMIRGARFLRKLARRWKSASDRQICTSQQNHYTCAFQGTEGRQSFKMDIGIYLVFQLHMLFLVPKIGKKDRREMCMIDIHVYMCIFKPFWIICFSNMIIREYITTTVETRYNEILGTEKFCLLYQIFCNYIYQ